MQTNQNFGGAQANSKEVAKQRNKRWKQKKKLLF